MNWRNNQTELTEIVRAFPPQLVGPQDELELRFEDDYESRRLDELLRKARSWAELHYDLFRVEYLIDPSIALFLMTPRGTNLFIAWFLKSVLTDPTEADVVLDGVVSFLTSTRGAGSDAETLPAFISMLNESQRRAIAMFLRFLRANYDGWFLRSEIEAGFIERWTKFLPRN